MPIEERPHASVIEHALARELLTTLRSAGTGRADFREGLVELGRICGYEIIDGELGTEPVTVRTPLAEAEGERVAGRDGVVVVGVLRAAIPLVEGLLGAFPAAKQGVISASRDEAAGMDEDGAFPVAIDYAKLPEITPEDTVIVADPMLATGSTMSAVLDRVLGAEPDPADLFVLSVVSAPAGVERIDREFPGAEVLTVSVDDRLDDEGFIVPGLGDAGDRAFGTT